MGFRFHRQPFMRMSHSLPGHWSRLFFFLATLCVGIGILVILFPLVLAIFVAAIFFSVALGCLRLAWLLFRRRKPTQMYSDEPRIHVEVHEETTRSDNDSTFLP